MSDRSPKTGGPNEPFDDPDAPPTEEEVAASKRLREALDAPALGGASADEDLVRSLRAAWSPDALDERAHAEVIDDLPMSDEELQLAAELREAIAGNGTENDDVVALRSAWAPKALADAEHRKLVESAVAASAPGKVIELRPAKSKPRPMRLVVATTTTVLAFAASVIVWVTNAAHTSEAPLARARSTQSLFDEPFKAGETSARIDRIASARASDYRDNRFAKWGVR